MKPKMLNLLRGIEEAACSGNAVLGDEIEDQDLLASAMHSRFVVESEDTGALHITNIGAKAMEDEGR